MFSKDIMRKMDQVEVAAKLLGYEVDRTNNSFYLEGFDLRAYIEPSPFTRGDWLFGISQGMIYPPGISIKIEEIVTRLDVILELL